MIDNSSIKDAARLRFLQGKGLEAWLDAIPTSRKLCNFSWIIPLGSINEVGSTASIYNWMWLWKDTGHRWMPSHYLQDRRGPVWSHNSVVSAWSECLKCVSLCHTIELRDCYSGSQSRPDIDVHNATDFNVKLDISLAHPWSSELILHAATTDGSAASKRKEKKIEKYSKERNTGGGFSCLISLVFEQCGCWGNNGEKVLHQISLRSRDEDGKLNSIEFITYWRRILSITLQCCNSSVLAKKIDRIVCSNDSMDDSYKHQVAFR